MTSNLSRLDWGAALSYIAGGGLAALGPLIGTFTSAKTTAAIISVIGIVTVIAGLLARLFKNPTPTNAVTVKDQATGQFTLINTVNKPGG